MFKKFVRTSDTVNPYESYGYGASVPDVHFDYSEYSTLSGHLKRPYQAINKKNGPGDIPDPDFDPPAGDAFGYLIDRKWYRKLRSIFLVSTYSRIHGPVFKNRFGVYGVCQERARHLASAPWIIHPYSSFRWAWDILVSFVLFLTLIIQPLMITFYVELLDDLPMVIVGAVSGLIYTIDIILNFRTGFVNPENDTIDLEAADISCQYLKTWFVIDLISTIPYDSFHFFLIDLIHTDGNHNHILPYMRLLELLKIFRLSRVIRYLTRIQQAYMISHIYVRITNLFAVMAFTLHWITCLHYLVADFCNPLGKRSEKSWVSQIDLWNATVTEKYLHAMLRASSNMAGLGYGAGGVPLVIEDILCTMFCMMIGASFFALFIGNLSSILAEVDVSQKKYAEIIHEVTQYLRFRQIPKDMQRRVILYYEHKFRRNYFNEEKILNSLSQVLRQELQMYICRRLIERVPIFRGLSATVIQSLINRIQYEVFLPNDVIIEAQSYGDSMYFIEHGLVCVLTPCGQPITQLSDGDFFGEMALLKSHKRQASIVALTYCDCYRLDRANFEEAVQGYPEIYEKLLKAAEERALETERILQEEQEKRKNQAKWKEAVQTPKLDRAIFDSSLDLPDDKSSTYTNIHR